MIEVINTHCTVPVGGRQSCQGQEGKDDGDGGVHL